MKPRNAQTDCNNFSRKAQTHDTKTKNIVSAHGHINIRQRYKYCPRCAARSYPLESQLGIDRKYTKSLKYFAARCFGLFSYRVAEENLRELCGISLSYVTISDLTLAVADEMKVGVLAKVTKRSERAPA